MPGVSRMKDVEPGEQQRMHLRCPYSCCVALHLGSSSSSNRCCCSPAAATAAAAAVPFKEKYNSLDPDSFHQPLLLIRVPEIPQTLNPKP